MQTDTTPRLAYGINQACETSGMGRSFIYEEIRAGKLKTFKCGARTLIASDDLRAWLDNYRSVSA